jgi:hypothetical protein
MRYVHRPEEKRMKRTKRSTSRTSKMALGRRKVDIKRFSSVESRPLPMAYNICHEANFAIFLLALVDAFDPEYLPVCRYRIRCSKGPSWECLVEIHMI